MGQVVSSVKQSNGFYTITVKPAKMVQNGPKNVSDKPLENASRYTISPDIVKKINTITFTDKKLQEKKFTQLEQIEMMSIYVPGENLPQLCDNYDPSKPSYFYFQMANKEQIKNR